MNDVNYSQYADNTYSQFGEDGIIEQLLDRIPDRNKWCVEFGAWDGVYLSNTYNLIKNKGYRSVLIEADKKKFEILQKNLAPFNAVLINTFVTFDGNSSLDAILEKQKIPKNFDFLSIDIDGNDYWIFESLSVYRPKIVCIEYNPTIPNDVEYVQSKDVSVKKGSSALSLCKLAKLKSYELVCVTDSNLFFVDESCYDYFQLSDNRLSTLRNDAESRVYAFVGYDGTVIHSKPIFFRWHDMTVEKEALQALPFFLRRFPSDYTIFHRLAFIGFLFFTQPVQAYKRIVGKFKNH